MSTEKITQVKMEKENRTWTQNLLSVEDVISIEQHIFSEKHTNFHFHGHYEFEILISGNATLYVDDKIIPLNNFDYYVISPGKIHRIENMAAPTVFLDVAFDENILNGPIADAFKCIQYPIFGRLSEELANYIGTSIELYKKAERKISAPDMYRQLIGNAVENILLFILNDCEDENFISRYKRLSKNRAFFEIIEYVNQNHTKNITNKDLAKKFGMTPNYIGRKFEYYTGKKISNYVNDLRLESAYKQLCITDESIYEIAHNLGFESMAHFYDIFKKKYNMTPKETRIRSANTEMK